LRVRTCPRPVLRATAAALAGALFAAGSLSADDAIDPYVGSDGFEFLAHEVGHRWLALPCWKATLFAMSAAAASRPWTSRADTARSTSTPWAWVPPRTATEERGEVRTNLP
jgi:hypothetical protein